MDDEKVDKSYKQGFNLGYWLNTNEDGEKHYKDLMETHQNPAFRETTIYQGLVAGREQAREERGLNQTHPILTGDQKKELSEHDKKERYIEEQDALRKKRQQERGHGRS